MTTATRKLNGFKVVRDTDTHRQISFEDEADPSAAALMRAQKRFRTNIQMETGRYVPLENIRVAYIRLSPTQLESVKRTFGDLPGDDSMQVMVSVPYAVSGGRAYVLLDGVASMNDEQRQAFLDGELLPFVTKSGLDADEVEPVLVPNRQR